MNEQYCHQMNLMSELRVNCEIDEGVLKFEKNIPSAKLMKEY